MVKATGAHPPLCPFCERPIAPPRDLNPKHIGDFSFGACECGAIYVYDVTGHNLGAAFSEALGFACDGDWDLAWDLIPGQDYEDALIEGYDHNEHLVHPTGRDREGRRVKGALTFIRLGSEFQALKAEGVRRRLEHQEGSIQSSNSQNDIPVRRRRRYSKREVERQVRAGGTEALTEMALEDPLVLRRIQRLLYAADEALRWQAVLTLGQVAARISGKRPAQVGDLVRRLIYASNDSAATNWGAIETVGEIIRNCPRTYGHFVNNLLALLRDPPSRPAVLWAIGRIGELHPEIIRSASFFAIFDLLGNEDPNIRGLSCWAFGKIGAIEARGAISKMIDDDEPVRLFDGEQIRDTTVGQLAKWSLDKFSESSLFGKGTQRKLAGSEGESMEQDRKVADSSEKQGEGKLKKAITLYREAEIDLNRGMSLDALLKIEEALGIFEEEGGPKEIANACEKKGDIHVMRGDFKAALPMYQRALAICEKVGDSISSVILVEKVIDLYRSMKQMEKALPYYYRALEIIEVLGDAGKAGLYLTGIGDIYQRQGELGKALEAYRLAIKIYRGMGSKERAEVLERGVQGIQERLGQKV